ncbi:MAG TPA: hypothetical protein ENN46_03985 [Candidatus Woesearchaeota archaeon]|nr:hypothetical protein [Candidatus Woesearchaeota archaeon]
MRNPKTNHEHINEALESAHSIALLISVLIINVFFVLSAILLSRIGLEIFLLSPFVYFLVVSYIGRMSADFSHSEKLKLDLTCLLVFVLNVVIFNAITSADPVHSLAVAILTPLIYLFFR